MNGLLRNQVGGAEGGSLAARFSPVNQYLPCFANSCFWRQLPLNRLLHVLHPFTAAYRSCQPKVTRNVTHW